VAGAIDYLIFKEFIPRPGWLIYSLFFLTFILMKNINLFNKKELKFFRSSFRNRSTSPETALWNILKSRNLDGRRFRRQSTTPAGTSHSNIMIINVIRPPLLQKEGKVL